MIIGLIFLKRDLRRADFSLFQGSAAARSESPVPSDAAEPADKTGPQEDS